ncbi:unnamed protein product [marine sediment metagenome]|uniref:Uncharacterized protein n=1 Tax=marine sediment metagenome TaxID=412755 RepID=X1QPK1_9ZZZZ
MPNKCEYCGSSDGQVDWHHPVPQLPSVGVYLCQRHHSLLYGRDKPCLGETRETMEADRQKIHLLVKRRVARTIQQLAYYLAEERFKG